MNAQQLYDMMKKVQEPKGYYFNTDRERVDELLESATALLLNKSLVQQGEIVVFTAGMPIGVAGGANMIKVVKIERAS